MRTLVLHRPDMPDLQFVLSVTALCTSRLPALNISNKLLTTIFNRCWMLIHDSPPPRKPEERELDLRPWSPPSSRRSPLTHMRRRRLPWQGCNHMICSGEPPDKPTQSPRFKTTWIGKISEKIVAWLCSLDSNAQQRDAADDGQPPDKGRKRNGLFLINRGLERADVDHILSGRIADALVDKCHDTEHDEHDAEDCCGFHVYPLSREAAEPVPSARRRSRSDRIGRRENSHNHHCCSVSRPSQPTGQS